MPIKSRQLLPVLWLCGTLVMPGRVAAQASRTTVLDFGTGSESEDYLRVLQVAGMEQLYPWTIRGFSPQAITRMAIADSAGPWDLRKNFNAQRFVAGGVNLGTTINTSFPYGANDGPVWAGRGITLVGSAGVG